MSPDNSGYSEQLLKEKYAAYKESQNLDQCRNDWHAGLKKKPWLIAEFQRFFEIGYPYSEDNAKRMREVLQVLRQRPGCYPLKSLTHSSHEHFPGRSRFCYDFEYPLEEDTFVVDFAETGLTVCATQESQPQVEILKDRQSPILHLPKGFEIPLIRTSTIINWIPNRDISFPPRSFTPHVIPYKEYAFWIPKLPESPTTLIIVSRAFLDKISWSKTPESAKIYS